MPLSNLICVPDCSVSLRSCDYDYVEVASGARGPRGLLESSAGRICGNWNERIKLLRFTAARSMQMVFVSDFSHAFKGFKAEVLIVTDDGECDLSNIEIGRNNRTMQRPDGAP